MALFLKLPREEGGGPILGEEGGYGKKQVKGGVNEYGLLRLIARISADIPNLGSSSRSFDATLPPKEQEKQKSF